MNAVGETPTTFSNLQCHVNVSDVCNRCHGYTEEMVATEAVHRAVMSPSAMDGVTDMRHMVSNLGTTTGVYKSELLDVSGSNYANVTEQCYLAFPTHRVTIPSATRLLHPQPLVRLHP